MIEKPDILIVDASVSARIFTRKCLEPLNGEITEVDTAQEALTLSLDGRFDLIIMEMELEGMSGEELCRQLKSLPVTKGIPVIMVGARDSETEIHKAFEAGISAFIPKSKTTARLLDRAKEILEKTQFNRERLILVVDDSKTVLRMVTKDLLGAGFQVVTAENGKKALAKLGKQRPDLILSDINMPEMDGFEFCETVCSSSELSSIPFVVMSTNDDAAHMRRMMQYGASAYLTKPFNLDQLMIIMDKLLTDQFQLLLKERERLTSERHLMLASITSLVSALEARDSYTKGHSESVAHIVSSMVKLKGAGKQEIETVTLGARLHDLGKIGVRDAVLLKPGKLTDEEFDEIKRHPVVGANIIKSIPSLKDMLPSFALITWNSS